MPIDVKAAALGALRGVRAVHSRAAGALVAAVPALEPAFIRVGRGILSRTQLSRSVYWFAEENLIERLRRSGNRFRRLRVAGHDLFADVTDGTGRLHHFHGEPYEPALVAALAAALRPGAVLLDVGANIGFMSTLGAKIVGPEGRVIAFEPHPQALELFRAAAKLNAVQDTIEVIEAAAGNGSAATIALHLTVDSVLSTTTPSLAPLAAHFPFTSAIDVPQVTIDDCMRARADLVPRIAAIKIDVEGGELPVLEGAAATLARTPAAPVFCETRPGSDADRWLLARGYRASPLDARPGSFGNYRYVR
jgi:FkbM family methyltransferase